MVDCGKMTTTCPSFFPSSTSSIIVILMLICLCHSSTSLECYWLKGTDRDSVVNMYIWNVNDTIQSATKIVDDDKYKWCIVVYAPFEYIGRHRVGGDSSWRQYTYSYAVGHDWPNACAGETKQRCALRQISVPSNVATGFVCCCNTTRCNNPIANAEMNPRLQYDKQLKLNGAQACYGGEFGFGNISDKLAVIDCTCAHDGTTDRCDWAEAKNGVCRLHWKTNDLECCCVGRGCNAEVYMNLTCRLQYVNTTNFKYGAGKCAAPRTTTTTDITTPVVDNKINPTTIPTTTTTNKDNNIVWITIVCALASIILLGSCVWVCSCIVAYTRHRIRREEANRDTDRSATSASISKSQSLPFDDSRTPSEREIDELMPRQMMGEKENEDYIRGLGAHANDTSQTLADCKTDFGSVIMETPEEDANTIGKGDTGKKSGVATKGPVNNDKDKGNKNKMNT